MNDETGGIIPPPEPAPVMGSGGGDENPFAALVKEPLDVIFIMSGLGLILLANILMGAGVNTGGRIVAALGAFLLSMTLFLAGLLRKDLDASIRAALLVAGGLAVVTGSIFAGGF